jgi:hypothetical protein
MRICSALVSVSLATVPCCGFAAIAAANVLITVDKNTQRMMVRVDGQLRWTWPVSTGISRYDTPDGLYTAFRMEAEHFSREWDDAPMPHSIFFTKQGHAIHGSFHSRLGRPASHGCVRLSPDNAAKLYALVQSQGLPNTKVSIEGELPSAPLVAERAPAAAPRRGMREQLPDATTPPPGLRTPEPLPQTAPVAGTIAPRPAFTSPFYARRTDSDAAVAAAPSTAERPRVYYYPRAYYRPRVYYDPRVEVIERSRINGVWVQRRYYRAAQPSDFRRWP